VNKQTLQNNTQQAYNLLGYLTYNYGQLVVWHC